MFSIGFEQGTGSKAFLFVGSDNGQCSKAFVFHVFSRWILVQLPGYSLDSSFWFRIPVSGFRSLDLDSNRDLLRALLAPSASGGH